MGFGLIVFSSETWCLYQEYWPLTLSFVVLYMVWVLGQCWPCRMCLEDTFFDRYWLGGKVLGALLSTGFHLIRPGTEFQVSGLDLLFSPFLKQGISLCAAWGWGKDSTGNFLSFFNASFHCYAQSELSGFSHDFLAF